MQQELVKSRLQRPAVDFNCHCLRHRCLLGTKRERYYNIRLYKHKTEFCAGRQEFPLLACKHICKNLVTPSRLIRDLGLLLQQKFDLNISRNFYICLYADF